VVSQSINLITLVVIILFSSGVKSKFANFRVTVENGEKILIIWIFELIWGYFVLNEFRVWIITFIAYWKSNQIKRLEDENKLNPFHIIKKRQG